MGRRALALVVACGAFAFAATPAHATDCDSGSPAAAQYCPPVELIGGGTDDPSSGSGNGDPSSAASGGLPFTGLDVGLAALAAAALLGAGAGLRRLSRTGDDSL